MPAFEIPVRVGSEESSVATPYHFSESGAAVIYASMSYLDDGIGGQGSVEVEDMPFPCDWVSDLEWTTERV